MTTRPAALAAVIATALVLGSTSMPASGAPALPVDTFFAVASHMDGLDASARTEHRPPDAEVSGSSWSAAENGSGYLSAGAWNPATSTNIRVYLYAPAGQDIQVGHTYRGLPLWYNRGTGAGASCDQATITVWELEAQPLGNPVTRLAMDVSCPNLGRYTVRINSNYPYAWLSASTPTLPLMYPGETADTTWTLTAHGTSPVSVSSLTQHYGEPVLTVGAETCSGATLDPGETCTAAIHVAPTGPGLQSGGIRIDTDLDPPTRYDSVNVGVADPWAVTPSNLALGSAPATSPSAPGEVTVRFTGPGSGAVQGVTLDGTTPAAFAIAEDGCTGTVLTDDETCAISVTGTPPGLTEVSATLIIDLGPGQPAKQVLLSVSGTNPVSMTPSVVLETIRPGQAADAVVTLSSAATVTQAITSVTLTGGSTDIFSIVANTCATGIPAGGSCTITVRYAPPSMQSPWDGSSQSIQLVVQGPPFVGYRTATITGSNALPSLGATWNVRSSLSGRWNEGGAMARATDGATTTLVQVTSAGSVGGKAIRNTGPYMPVYLNRSTNGGASWSSTKRVNPTTKHGFWPSAGASGRTVAVAWVSAAKVFNMSTTAPRVLWVRVSTNSGNGSWRTAHRLTSTSRRVDHPAVAVSGSTVVVGYTDSGTGDVKVAISKDRGSTWRTVKVGTATARMVAGGRTGLVNVAVSGKTIVVAWIGSLYGTTKVRVSTNTGASFGTALSLTGAQDRPALAIAGSRIGVAWLDGNLNVRIRTSGTWGPARIVPTGWGIDGEGNPMSYQLYGAEIALHGTTGVAASTSGDYYYCAACDDGRGSDLTWSESSTNGATWTRPDRVVIARDEYAWNDYPSVIWRSATERLVLVNRFGTKLATALVSGATSGLAPASAVGGGGTGPDGSAASTPATVVPATAVPPARTPAGLSGPWGPAGPPAADR